SSANMRWCVPKQVPICVSCFVFGSYIARCRLARASGKSLADGWLDPALQKSGVSDPRIADVIPTRPRSSSIGLGTVFLLGQSGSHPQYGDGCGNVAEAARALVSRSVSGTRLETCRTGSRTGR